MINFVKEMNPHFPARGDSGSGPERRSVRERHAGTGSVLPDVRRRPGPGRSLRGRRARVLIIGSGVAGTQVANRLVRKGCAEVIVLNTFPDHLNQPAFLHLPFGRRFRTSAPAARLLTRGVRFRQAKVVELDPRRRHVRLRDGERIPFDVAVVATGSFLRHDDPPGLDEHAHNFHCRHGARLLRRALWRFAGGRIVVGVVRPPYKCPPSPHEFVLLLDEFLKARGQRGRAEILFVHPLQRVFPDPAAADLFEGLFREAGIRTETGFEIRRIEPGRLVGTDGREIRAELIVLVPPHRGARFLSDSGIASADGWVPVDRETLRFGEGIYALGDAADLPVPKSGAAASYQSAVVAENVVAEIEGRPPESRYDGHAT